MSGDQTLSKSYLKALKFDSIESVYLEIFSSGANCCIDYHRRTGHFLEGGWIDFARKNMGQCPKNELQN